MSQMPRTSVVGSIRMHAVTSASALQVGDLDKFAARSRALAVQRQVSHFLENEGDLRQFALFSRPIPQPPMTEQVRIDFFNEDPYIRAERIRVISAAASSLVHVGAVRQMELEARVKHIRQFVNAPQSDLSNYHG